MASELDSYLQMIEALREQVCDLISGLPPQALNWRPLEGVEEHATNSLGILASHVAGAEHFWIGETVGALPATRDRESEFRVEAENAATLVSLLEDTGMETRRVFSALRPADLDGVREARGRPVPVRWCILHVVEHTALHLGHMQITCQLWQSSPSSPLTR